MQRFIDGFSKYLSIEKNVSEHTHRNYISDLAMFRDYVAATFGIRISNFRDVIPANAGIQRDLSDKDMDSCLRRNDKQTETAGEEIDIKAIDNLYCAGFLGLLSKKGEKSPLLQGGSLHSGHSLNTYTERVILKQILQRQLQRQSRKKDALLFIC